MELLFGAAVRGADMTVFARIKDSAKKQGLTLLQISEQAGLGEKTLYKWKSTEPGADRLNKVADILHVSVDYLLGNTDDPTPARKGAAPRDLDLKSAAADPDTVMSWNGRPIPPEEMEMIRRILEGGK